MTDGFLKKTGQTARDLAKKTARQVAREPLEILKSAAPAQLREKDSLNIPQEQIMTAPPKAIDNIDVNALNTQTQKRLEELEQEIQKIRQDRAAKLQKWNEDKALKKWVNRHQDKKYGSLFNQHPFSQKGEIYSIESSEGRFIYMWSNSIFLSSNRQLAHVRLWRHFKTSFGI